MTSEILSTQYILAVLDLEAAEKFYCDQLGFTKESNDGNWLVIRRGACQMRLGHCPDAVPMSQCPDHGWFAYLVVSDATSYYNEVVEKGANVSRKLTDRSWGMREFTVESSEGHRIVFGEVIAEAKA